MDPDSEPFLLPARTPQHKSPALQIPNFVEQYYKTSTFHHLSAWRLQFQRITTLMTEKARMLRKRRKGNKEKSSSDEGKSNSGSGGSGSTGSDSKNMLDIDSLGDEEIDNDKRMICHVDMDCFYVSVLIRNRPELAGKPVIVCPAKNVNGTSEVASASYAARQFGIKPRMFVSEARGLCPDLVCLPADFPMIEDASARLYEQILKFSLKVEAVSADEAYLDVSRWGWDQVDSFAQRIKKDVETATGCPCSVGVGPNKLMARISTALAKPSGIHIARLADVPRILSQLRVADLPGVGNITAGKLAQFDVNSIDQLLLCSLKDIKHWVGEKNGLMLFNFARGLDNRPVKTRHDRKSVGTQISWGVRLFSVDDVRSFITDMAKEVSRRLKEINMRGQRVTLRVLKKDAPGEAPKEVKTPWNSSTQHGAVAPPPSAPQPSFRSALAIDPPAPPPGEPRKYMNPGAHTPMTRSAKTLPTDDPAIIAVEAFKLFRAMQITPEDFRGGGISVDQLEEAGKAPAIQSIRSFFAPKHSNSPDISLKDEDMDDDYNGNDASSEDLFMDGGVVVADANRNDSSRLDSFFPCEAPSSPPPLLPVTSTAPFNLKWSPESFEKVINLDDSVCAPDEKPQQHHDQDAMDLSNPVIDISSIPSPPPSHSPELSASPQVSKSIILISSDDDDSGIDDTPNPKKRQAPGVAPRIPISKKPKPAPERPTQQPSKLKQPTLFGMFKKP